MRRLSLCVAAALLWTGCDTDPAAPTNADVAGSYEATTLTTTSGGSSTNQLAQGASLTIQLAANGTTTGHVIVPGTGGAEGLDADLTGTWTISGSVVDFSHPADTFVRDMSFLVQGQTLVGDQNFAGTQVHVVLSKQ